MSPEDFAPITLAEMDERDDLQRRVDYKYIVRRSTLNGLLDALADDYLALDVGGLRLQQYDSTYFDTPALANYRAHLQGRRKRFKARTRLYNDGPCFFDVKLRGRRGETVKRRLELNPAQHGTLTPKMREYLALELSAFYGIAPPTDLRVALHTSFARLSLIHAHRDERLTVDLDVMFESVDGDERWRMQPDYALIETKAAARGRADKLLRRAGAHPLSLCSKYCIGVARTRPEAVVVAPVRPLIRRYLDPEPVGA